MISIECRFSNPLSFGLKPVERKPRKFNPLVIPKSLQAILPFASKPKDPAARKQRLLETKRAVVMEPHERKVHTLVQHLQLIKTDKVNLRINLLFPSQQISAFLIRYVDNFTILKNFSCFDVVYFQPYSYNFTNSRFGQSFRR